MARIRITFYKHSILANIVGLLGTMLSFLGVVYIVLGIMDFAIGIILLGIVLAAGGVGCFILADKLNVPKAKRTAQKAQAVSQQKQPPLAPEKKEINVILQRNPAECGIACLYMILNYYGKAASLDQLCEECAVNEKGSNAAEMQRAAKRHGLDCHGYRVDAAQLRNMNKPVIIHWKFNHFVILEEIMGNIVSIVDPAVGRYRIDFESLQQDYSGVVLTFDEFH